MPPGTTQLRQIVIKVDAAGVKEALDKISSSMGSLNKNTKSIKDNIQGLTSVFQGWVAFLGVRELARMSDEMQNLGNRLKIVSKAGENTSETMASILALANRTNQSVSETAEVYTRMGTSLKAAHASSAQLLAVTEVLINSFRISGSTNTETTATIIQLSQAFASGTLRGQELRSVMLQNAELARLLRERFGKDLADKAEKGLISVIEVLKILRDNLGRINEQAKVLTPTFEQTITKAFNVAQFAIDEFNKKFDVAGKFSVIVNSIIRTVYVLGLAFIDLGKFIRENVNFELLAIQAFALLAVMNPLAASLLLVTGGAIESSGSVAEFIDKLRNLGAWCVQVRIWVEELDHAIGVKFARTLNHVGLLSQDLKEELAGQITIIKELKETAEGLGRPKYQSVASDADKFSVEAQKKAIEELIKTYGKLGFGIEKVKKVKEILGEINAEFLKGAISVESYNAKLVNFELYKLNREFREGKFDIFTYNKKLGELKIQELNRELKHGFLTLVEYKNAVEAIKLDELNQKFQAGKIGLIEYNDELIKVSQKFEPGGALVSGTASYLESIGTVSQGVAGAIKNTFSALEDNLVDFMKTGRFNFAKFTQAILDDLLKIIVRASIIQPLANAILNFGTPTTATRGTAPDVNNQYPSNEFAKGGMFSGGLKKFAAGGIVGKPTMFGYGSGRRGLMGEAGPEAILPLARGSGGDLGVKAVVTPVNIIINNHSGADVQQKETTGPSGERTIELLIQSKVKEGLASGTFDKAMLGSYGVRRRGS